MEVSEPHPWGLMISFRELIQNNKYGFAKKSTIKENHQAIKLLFQTKLAKFQNYNRLNLNDGSPSNKNDDWRAATRQDAALNQFGLVWRPSLVISKTFIIFQIIIK